jgi:hypothetical protein
LESFNSTCITSAQLDALVNNDYKPLYVLAIIMEDKRVSNDYDWAELKYFVNANEKQHLEMGLLEKKMIFKVTIKMLFIKYLALSH